MTVKELLARIDSRELSEWTAYYQIEPFGEFRADIRSAIIATTLANIHRGKDQQPFRIKDFMPKFEIEKQSPDEMAEVLKRFAIEMGKVKK